MRIMQKMRTVIIFCAVSVLLAAITAASIYAGIAYYAGSAKPQKSDVIIVLGCQVVGHSPSWSLLYRLEKAVELYNSGYGKYIIVSGGRGKDELVTEASVMKKWLADNGVPEDLIVEEDSSASTYQNLKLSKDIMQRMQLNSAVIVTNDFHVFRSLKLAKRLDMQASGAAAKSVGYLKLYNNTREILSVVKAILLGR